MFNMKEPNGEAQANVIAEKNIPANLSEPPHFTADNYTFYNNLTCFYRVIIWQTDIAKTFSLQQIIRILTLK